MKWWRRSLTSYSITLTPLLFWITSKTIRNDFRFLLQTASSWYIIIPPWPVELHRHKGEFSWRCTLRFRLQNTDRAATLVNGTGVPMASRESMASTTTVSLWYFNRRSKSQKTNWRLCYNCHWSCTCSCHIKVRDGSLFMRMTGLDKKCPGNEKFLSRNDGLWIFSKAKWPGSEKKFFNILTIIHFNTSKYWCGQIYLYCSYLYQLFYII